ncbi:class I SAM-dependent methyltransferase [Pontiella agarivorans]|uniref:Class I SAM-dependent methyltransferase n=1 Tax=Pontiella agarivorans TaxID=3038953 RepID=A0ABU5N052_9BACT|nr:class I SAM-dependent methyltransferase [Pontiella agarivorans]MDZ8119820.1 class I SAM-dependent methyltransferase [Pontiella agarivorans]
MENLPANKQFYNRAGSENGFYYPSKEEKQNHPYADYLRGAIARHQLKNQKVLEIGSGIGAFQDFIADYTGTDFSETVTSNYHKPFFCADAKTLPFPDNTFDAVFTHAVLEHIPDPEKALKEMRRVLKSGGILLLHAAWHVPWFASEGYTVRQYAELPPVKKVKKVCAHLWKHPLSRALDIVTCRFIILLRHLLFGSPKLHYKKRTANYETFWCSDSDACNSIDQLEAGIWFVKQGDEWIAPGSALKKFFMVRGELELRINKDDPAIQSTL